MAKKKSKPKAQKFERANYDLKAKGGIERVNGRDINTKTDIVATWSKMGKLTDSHKAAIAYCYRIWELLYAPVSVTVNYGESFGGAQSSDSGYKIIKKIDAQNALDRITGKTQFTVDGGLTFIKGYVPKARWDVFENCVRFNEPTGQITSGFVRGTENARARAHETVCMVAELICLNEGLD
jgi:hypothetical protein